MIRSIFNFWYTAAFLWFCGVVVAFAWTPPLVAWLDNRYFPIVEKFEVSRVVVTPTEILVSGRLFKPEWRARCDLVSVVATINKEETYRLFSSDDKSVFTRAWGWSSFQDWRIPGSNIKHVLLTSRHQCHDSWTNVTTLLDSPIPPVIIFKSEK